MFPLFKRKSTLAEIIPENYVDFHSHVLPGIDDGAKTIDDAFFLLQAMTQLGFAKCITTPHTNSPIYPNTTASISETFNNTQIAAAKKGIQIPLEAASEYMINSEFVKKMKTEPLLCVHQNFVLVEIPFVMPPMGLKKILFDLQLIGYVPILAHPERYLYYKNDLKAVEELKKAGCLLQLNLLSTVGYYGKEVTQLADKLLQKGWIDFTGSDIHHAQHVAAFDNRLVIKNTAALETAMKQNQLFK